MEIKDKRNLRIREIARFIYIKSQNKGLENNPERDWKEAESLYNNNLKYYLWKLWQFLLQYHYQILAIAAIISILVTVYGVLVARTTTDLNIRPYVSIDMEYPKTLSNQNDTFYGNNIISKNSGKIPASNISTKYYITTDLDKEDMSGFEWFKKTLGGYGATAFIIPDGIEIEPGFRSLSPSAEYYYFEALICYEGLKKNKKYWTHIKKVFFVDRNSKNLYPVWNYGSWDRNADFNPPAISSKEQVVDLLDEIKQNRKK